MIDGLYDVPQTDDTGEAAMAALIVRLRASIPKPETIPLESAEPGTNARLALKIAEVVADIGTALADRATLPLLKWDAKLDGVCRRISYRDWMNTRGRERKQGADNSIDADADDARAYLDKIAAAVRGEGKVRHPRYIDSGGNVPRDSVRVNSSARSDDWTRTRLPARRV